MPSSTSARWMRGPIGPFTGIPAITLAIVRGSASVLAAAKWMYLRSSYSWASIADDHCVARWCVVVPIGVHARKRVHFWVCWVLSAFAAPLGNKEVLDVCWAQAFNFGAAFN